VNIDYHVDVEKHLYSVPHQLIHEKVDVRVTATMVDLLLRGVRVYLHRRSFDIGGYTTIPEHMPKAHRAHAEWSPSRLIRWGGTIGPQTAALVAAILESRRHPEQGYRSCLGLLRLSKHYPAERLEAACARALLAGARSYRHVANILKHGLDRTTGSPEPTAQALPLHENVRGADFYATVKGLSE
jgi:transposase